MPLREAATTHAYLRSVDRVDPVAALAQVKAPLLIIQGGRDDSVPATHADMLRIGRTTLPTQVATFPSLTHFYKVAPPGLPPMQSMGLETPSDPAVADAIAAWASHLRPVDFLDCPAIDGFWEGCPSSQFSIVFEKSGSLGECGLLPPAFLKVDRPLSTKPGR